MRRGQASLHWPPLSLLDSVAGVKLEPRARFFKRDWVAAWVISYRCLFRHTETGLLTFSGYGWERQHFSRVGNGVKVRLTRREPSPAVFAPSRVEKTQGEVTRDNAEVSGGRLERESREHSRVL